MLNNKKMANTFAATQNLIQFSIENMEKSAQLQLNVSKDLMNDTFSTLSGLTKVTSVKDLFAYTSQLANTSVEKNVTVFNQACDLINTSQVQFGKLVADINDSVIATASNSVKNSVTK